MKENTEVKISIIVPVYNTGLFLRQCLDSICNQTFKDIEVIVVNDGSTDNSAEIIHEYVKKDKRIVVIEQENQGLSAARNSGLSKCSGKYVMFVDSDDWIDTVTCEQAFKAANRYEADVVLWSYTREYSTGAKKVNLFQEKELVWDKSNIALLYWRIIGLREGQLREPQKIDAIVTAWGKLYRRDCINEILFVDTKVIGTEDALFNVQVFSKVKRAAYLPKTYSHYRKTNQNSLTRKYKNKMVSQWQELYRRIGEHLKCENAPKECYEALNNRIALGLIGLGLNLAEDDKMQFIEKYRELKHILAMPHYQKALEQLPMDYFKVHWKVFFLLAKHGLSFLLLLLLIVMNRMRGI